MSTKSSFKRRGNKLDVYGDCDEKLCGNVL